MEFGLVPRTTMKCLNNPSKKPNKMDKMYTYSLGIHRYKLISIFRTLEYFICISRYYSQLIFKLYNFYDLIATTISFVYK
jgi:hypothetical protein